MVRTPAEARQPPKAPLARTRKWRRRQTAFVCGASALGEMSHSRTPSPSGRDSRRGLARRLAHSRQTLSLYGLSGRSPKPQSEVRLLGPRSARRWVGALSYRMVGDCLHQGLVARIGWPGDTSRAANNSARGDAQVGCHPLAENTSSGERRGKSTPPDTGRRGRRVTRRRPPPLSQRPGDGPRRARVEGPIP